MRFQKGPLNVEAILEKDKSRVRIVFWERRSDQINCSRSDVRHTFGAKNDVVVRRKLLGVDIWDAVAHCDVLAILLDGLLAVMDRVEHTNVWPELLQ